MPVFAQAGQIQYSHEPTNERIVLDTPSSSGETEATYYSPLGSLSLGFSGNGLRIGAFLLLGRDLPETETRNIELTLGQPSVEQPETAVLRFDRNTGEFVEATNWNVLNRLEEFWASQDGALFRDAAAFLTTHRDSIAPLMPRDPEEWCRYRTSECLLAVAAAAAAAAAVALACVPTPILPPRDRPVCSSCFRLPPRVK